MWALSCVKIIHRQAALGREPPFNLRFDCNKIIQMLYKTGNNKEEKLLARLRDFYLAKPLIRRFKRFFVEKLALKSMVFFD